MFRFTPGEHRLLHNHLSRIPQPARSACADPWTPKWVLHPHGPQADRVMAITGPVLPARERRLQTEKQPAHVHRECLRGQMLRHALARGAAPRNSGWRCPPAARVGRAHSGTCPSRVTAAKPKGRGRPRLGSSREHRGELKMLVRPRADHSHTHKPPQIPRMKLWLGVGRRDTPACLRQIPDRPEAPDEHMGEHQTPGRAAVSPPPWEPVFLELFPRD